MKQDGHKMLFGFSVLLVLAILATIISLGHVEEKTSFGLSFVLGALSSLSGAFGNWAFSNSKSHPESTDEKRSRESESAESSAKGTGA
jgi:hypothetical protein